MCGIPTYYFFPRSNAHTLVRAISTHGRSQAVGLGVSVTLL